MLLADPEQATGDRVSASLGRMGARRLYAFVQPHRRQDRLQPLLLEEMAGPVIYRVGRPRAAVRVVFLPTALTTSTTGQTALEQKRSLYWHNAQRNEHIALVARAVAALDVDVLTQHGLRNMDIRLIKQIDRPRVKVLVESPEHGRQLLTLLAGWHLLELTQEARPAPNHSRAPAIMTLSYARRRSTQADVLIRATGTEWPLRLKGFPLRRKDSQTGMVLVLDFDDRGHVQAQRDSQRRQHEHQRQGHEVVVRSGGDE